MHWSNITAAPPQKMLRQFAGLFLLFCVGLAGWRVWNGQTGVWASVLAFVGVGVGVCGLVRPSAVRWIYAGWMVAAFPIGWTISWLALAAMFYGVFAPVALVFRLMKRDALNLRRRNARSYWTAKTLPSSVASYFRQS